MADDIPDPDRTVTVEKAHLLREQVEHSKERATEGDGIDEVYHRKRVEFTENYIEQIESEGVSETEIENSLDELEQTIEQTEPNTKERLEAEAKFDTLKQTYQRYFDDYLDVVIAKHQPK